MGLPGEMDVTSHNTGVDDQPLNHFTLPVDDQPLNHFTLPVDDQPVNHYTQWMINH